MHLHTSLVVAIAIDATSVLWRLSLERLTFGVGIDFDMGLGMHIRRPELLFCFSFHLLNNVKYFLVHVHPYAIWPYDIGSSLSFAHIYIPVLERME